MPQFAEFLKSYRAHAKASLLAFDFDGTLSPIVATPDQAQLDPDLTPALQILGEQSNVAIISGRPSDFLKAQFAGIKATLIGNYGRPETLDGRALALHKTLASRARAELPDAILVEVKPSSIALHYRRAPEFASAVTEWAKNVQSDPDISVEDGKSVVEIVVGINSTKDAVLSRLARSHPAVLYAGDDNGDLAALNLLRTLPAVTCGLVVVSHQTPPALIEAADEPVTREQFRSYLHALAGVV
ncbi:trehalose-phosphatase [Ferrimicrobium sp.]|uniref:trehalose-phosphatase n=1 Tax=Ferrimicrobium sp. TaxID=2926050 RepID=UPI0026364209|nr:trehalose-phosphatase [Ferrimicrobium sp.]